MATREDVRRIALSLPRTSEAADHSGFGTCHGSVPRVCA
jgi:hypothetical protein